MNHEEIRKRFLGFFEKRGHSVIPSASLVPENDPSVLFTTAGMQPLVPYLLGQTHPAGKRLVNIQKCLRTGDIDEVGDSTHLTFFEMMGNWSLGDYFKEDAIKWSYELLTNKEEGFGLDPQRLYVTCFEGNENAPKDEESYKVWSEIFKANGVTGERIYFRPAEKNWWSAGENGPCGPDTEMFYDLTGTLNKGMTLEEYLKADDEQKIVEIWNDVFMEYLSKDGKVVGKLDNKNVDTGSGLERVSAVLQGKTNVFETDLFSGIIDRIKSLSPGEDSDKNLKSRRIIADHIRSSVFLISDGVIPSNTEQGYILRRLIRRAVRNADLIGMTEGALGEVAEMVVNEYGGIYKNIFDLREKIREEIEKEEDKFRQTLVKGLKQLEKLGSNINGKDAFDLYQTYGFPVEMTKEILKEKGITFNQNDFDEELKKHSELSATSSAGKFKGGLAGTGEMEIKYHTATHLLNASLRKILGTTVEQKGSNITAERLRYDFSHPQKMTDEEIKKVEDLVNEKIKEELPVSFVEVSLEEARNMGALGVFGDKYGEKVKVYKIGPDKNGEFFSMEICGGPHVENTKGMGNFKITKEEASSAGIRRIKAILE
jgi:alanyl-tRNA synthetase